MSEFNLAFVDYLILGLYFFLMLSINWIVKIFRSRKPVKEKDLENYFLIGRKLTLPMFVATLTTTWYGNLLGVFEMAYKEGVVQWLTQGIFWYATYIVFAFFLAKKIRESGLFTIPDQLEKFYGPKTAILGALINLIILSPAPYIISMGVIFQIVFGLAPEQAIFFGILIPFIYVFKDGYEAVVYTDMVHFVFMFAGLALIFPFAISKFGFQNLVSGIPPEHLHITGSFSWQVILAWFLIATWTFIDTSFYQTTYASIDVETAQQGVLISTVFWVVFDLMVTCCGLFAFAAMPHLDPVLALPTFANAVLPQVAKGIFFAGLIATVISTLDSLTFSSAMCVSKDLFMKIFKIEDNKKIIVVNKISLVLVVVFGLIVAFNFKSLIQIMYYKGSLGISGLLIPLMSSYFFKNKLSASSAFLSMLLGFSSCLAWILLTKTGVISINIEPLFVGLFFALLPVFYNLIFLISSTKKSRA